MSHILKLNATNNQYADSISEVKQKLVDISNGIFALTEDEQAQVDNMQQMYNDLVSKQRVANKNDEGAVTTAGIRSGRQEFMNDVQSGEYKQAVDDGIQKVKNLEAEAASKIAALKRAFRDDDYKMASELYNTLQDDLDNKTLVICICPKVLISQDWLKVHNF